MCSCLFVVVVEREEIGIVIYISTSSQEEEKGIWKIMPKHFSVESLLVHL